MRDLPVSAHAWLWPDKVIGMSGSRQLRDEHNRIVNSHTDLLAASTQALAALDKIMAHPAFGHPAPEFNKGGCGYEAYFVLRDAVANADSL